MRGSRVGLGQLAAIGGAISLTLAFFVQSSVAASANALSRQLAPSVTVTAKAETGGQVTFIGTEPGEAIPLDAASPRNAAVEAANRFAPHFGLGGDAELKIADVSRLAGGRTAFRFQQTINGLPVIGGQLTVNLDASEELLSVGGELEPVSGIDDTTSVSEGAASSVALAATAKRHGVLASSLQASPGKLSIYDPRLLGGPGLELPRTVWRFEVTGGDPRTIRELVLIDAQLGNVALSFSEIDRAKLRWVCDAAFTESHYSCEFGDAARSEGDGATGIAEVDSAYDLSGLVYDFYLSRLERDSIDGSGMAVVSNVRYCEASCPSYENAFWNGSQATFGPGWVTDDVLAHELTHGVVEREAGLFYYYQSGAINESFADVFGELFDLSTGSDPPSDRWLVGEESSSGAIRDMANPPSFFDPDRTGSPNWYFNSTTSFEKGDAGGVHSNSGVSNKLASLLTDGGEFNGQAVTGLGADKVLRVYDEANVSLLTSGSDYADLGQALQQACVNLTGLHGFTASDCVQVDSAVLATEMDLAPSLGPVEAGLCAGQSPVPVFFDDMESPLQGNWSASVTTGPGAFFYPQSFYAASGSTHIAGRDWDEISDSAITMTKGVTVPAGGLMHFKHAYGFESTEAASYDGGVIEYSANGGASWHDAGNMIVAGEDYTDTLATISGNPLGGRLAFTSDSAGYGSTRLDLAPLVGQQVRFRFRLGSDESVDDYGWFIDDVQIYHCGNGAPPAEAAAAAIASNPPPQPSPVANDDCAKAKLALTLATANVTRARRALSKSRHQSVAKKTTRKPARRRQQAVRTAAKREREARAAVEQSC